MKAALTPHVTEKSYAGIHEEKGATSTYTFRVAPKLTKELVKKFVEREFKVTVVDVRIVNLPGKKRRFKNITGRTSDRKKAIVRLAPDQKIAAFDLPDDKAETKGKE